MKMLWRQREPFRGRQYATSWYHITQLKDTWISFPTRNRRFKLGVSMSILSLQYEAWPNFDAVNGWIEESMYSRWYIGQARIQICSAMVSLKHPLLKGSWGLVTGKRTLMRRILTSNARVSVEEKDTRSDHRRINPVNPLILLSRTLPRQLRRWQTRRIITFFIQREQALLRHWSIVKILSLDCISNKS